jgi:hypothetical protein
MNKKIPAVMSPHGNHIALCVEHRRDSPLVQAMFHPWICKYFETSNHDCDDSFIENTAEEGEVIWSSLKWSKETTIQMVLGAHGPTPSQMRWMLEAFNLRTGARTLQLFSEFDKSFMNDVLVKETTLRPPRPFLGQSRASLLQLALEMRLKTEVVLAGIERFDE